MKPLFQTPRTDALRDVAMTRLDSDNFARELKRELAAERAKVAELAKALNFAMGHGRITYYERTSANAAYCDAVDQARRALANADPAEQARYAEMLKKEEIHWRGIEKHGYDPTP